MGPLTFHGNILTELQKDVKNFAGGNLRFLIKTGRNTPRISISWI